MPRPNSRGAPSRSEAPVRSHIGDALETQQSSTEVKSVAAAVGQYMSSTTEAIREYLSGGSGGEEDPVATAMEYVIEDTLSRKIEREEAEQLKLEAKLADRKAAKSRKPASVSNSTQA